jgi:hypothetical protein
MQVGKQRILGLLALPAVVLAGLVLLRPASNPQVAADVQPNARNKDTPHQAEAVTPSSTPLARSASPPAAAATSPISAPSPTQLWAAPGETTGEKLDPKSASYAKAQGQGVKPKGRSSPFDPRSLTPLGALRRGGNVVIPLLGGEQVTGKVNLVQQEAGGWVRVGGELTGPRAGSFSLGSSGKSAGATILLPQEQIAYTITEQPDGQTVMQERPLSDVICFPLPRPKNEPVIAVPSLGPQEPPPILSSRPAATAVLYLDFDGETVIDPRWNSGNAIGAQPSSLTGAEVAEVWNRVKEDYWPFNIDVTTDVTRYDNAPVGRRMRCIITPTCAWYTNVFGAVGGVAAYYSFAQAGQLTFSSTVPCWVFIDYNAKYVAEAASHELGHTLGLHHDGREIPGTGHEEYYAGHGIGAVGWAPIMGVSYYKELTQWSKGEYLYANNQEDDLAIIANAANGFGYVADEAGNSLGSAAALIAPGGAVNQTGIISGNNDIDFYVFTAGAGGVTISANPAPISPNLDILLELRNSIGTVLASSNPDTALDSSISCNVAAGTYYIGIQGAGRGDVLGDGYSTCGSIGYYSLSGRVDFIAPAIATQPQSQLAIVGADVGFSVIAAGSAPFDYQWFFNGQPISAATDYSYSIASVQSNQAGAYTVRVTNSYGSVVSAPATLIVYPQAPTIITQPQSQTVTAGASAGFSVIAVGVAPLNYQWFFSGQPISAATGSSYSIARVQSSQAGTYSVVVSNSYGSAQSASATLAITLGSGAFGVVGAPFSYQIVANNNPTWYSASGLPSGLSCGGTSGLISGIPTQTGTFSVYVQARNVYGYVASATVLFTIANGSITSATDAQGVVGAPFSYQITADNSPTWYTASGLPSGLSCGGTSGLISGTPAQAGTFSVHVEARNAYGFVAATNVSLTINSPAIFSAASAQGVVGAPFLYRIIANNSPTWYSASGLPSGLGCDGTSGLISGIPTQTGTFGVHVGARNASGFLAAATVSLTVTNGAIISATSAEGVVGAPFLYRIIANNSPTWYSASGLPTGLGCGGTSGLISGIPTQTGTFPVHVEAKNASGFVAAANVSLTIADGAIISATSAEGVVGAPFGYQIIANNSPTWYSASGLPTGLGCGGTSGLISGAPRQAGTFSVQVEAKNAYGFVATAPVSLTITGGTVSQLKLAVSRTGNGVVFTWPVTSDSFVLEETQLLPNAWTNSSAAVTVEGSNNAAAIAPTGTAKFYRLRK